MLLDLKYTLGNISPQVLFSNFNIFFMYFYQKVTEIKKPSTYSGGRLVNVIRL